MRERSWGPKSVYDCDPHRLAELTRSCKRHRLEQTRPHAKRRRHRQRSSTCSSIRMRGALRAPEQGAFHDQRAPPEPRRGPVARVHSAPPSAHSPRASLRLQDLISAGNGRPPLDLLQPSGARRARTRDVTVARTDQGGPPPCHAMSRKRSAPGRQRRSDHPNPSSARPRSLDLVELAVEAYCFCRRGAGAWRISRAGRPREGD